MHSRPIHFEIYADDLERAKKFYADLFGWTYQTWDFNGSVYYGVLTAPEGSTELGINGGLLKRPGGTVTGTEAVVGYACTMGVASVDDTIKKVLELGGSVALPKVAIPGMAWQAYCKDTEGNIFGIHQPDTSAK